MNIQKQNKILIANNNQENLQPSYKILSRSTKNLDIRPSYQSNSYQNYSNNDGKKSCSFYPGA